VSFGFTTLLEPARFQRVRFASTRTFVYIAVARPQHGGLPPLHALSSHFGQSTSQQISPLRAGWRHTSSTVQDENAKWTVLPNGVRMQVLERSSHDDRPVTHGQTVRIAYVARLDDGSECARAEASFRLGQGTVCEALDQGVIGMCVGDMRRLRASGFLRRGPALAAAPADEVIEYQVQLTGAVHHMQIVTFPPKPGSDDPLQVCLFKLGGLLFRPGSMRVQTWRHLCHA
jgi:hypothetical protein